MDTPSAISAIKTENSESVTGEWHKHVSKGYGLMLRKSTAQMLKTFIYSSEKLRYFCLPFVIFFKPH
jgi:hypothetical protein